MFNFVILQADPTLSPDDVKCRLMASAKGARNDDGSPRFSILQQGSGLVDAYGAVYSTVYGCANRGLDITQNLAGETHYAGLVHRDDAGNYYLEAIENQSMLWADAMLWSDSMLWADSMLWSDSMLWADSMLWSDSLVEPVDINVWVPQE